jgi:HEAT repeat protein
VSEVKQMLVFSKLDQQSASQRIQAVNYARDITTPDYQIISALIKTMNTDENSNVRMAAIQALSRFTEESIVVDALVSSLDIQTDPLLQITLINILVELKEERAVDAMKKLLDQEETHETVKRMAQKGLTII